jgi:ribosomal protein S12 methylthiotransferase
VTPRKTKSSSSAAPQVGFVSLGCPKALVDSERIITRLRLDGYAISNSYQGADVVIVNTCGFIDSAKAESLEAIGEALNENGKVIVTGCLGAKEAEIRAAFPNLLHVTGPQQTDEVVNAVRAHVPPPPAHDPFLDLVPPQGIKLTPKHYAYLKISEGCNHRCTFCIIPSMRGDLVSRPFDQVMQEAEALAAAGVRELLIISQDTSAYGADQKYPASEWRGQTWSTRFGDLCRALGDLGIWIRLHYVYPYPHVDEVLPLMAEGKVLPYLDIPFQHGSPKILKLMRRPAAAEDTLARIRRWREICPALTIRSTFIVGFPGETDADFEALLAFLEIAQLDRVGCFKYSPVDGARANALPDPVPEDVKTVRWERFMQVQQDISRRRLAAKIGQTLEVLVDRIEGGTAIARSAADAPEIDGQVFISEAGKCAVGSFQSVLVVGADEYDLHARPATS